MKTNFFTFSIFRDNNSNLHVLHYIKYLNRLYGNKPKI